MNRFLPVLLTVLLTGCGKDSNTPEKSGDQLSTDKNIDQEPTSRVVITPKAAAQVRKLMQQTQSSYLRVYLSPDRQYKLDLDIKYDPKQDVQCESQGLTVVIERKDAEKIPAGMVVDYVDEAGQKEFTFSAPQAGLADTSVSLVEARRDFKTKLTRRERDGEPAPTPPQVFRLVRYDAPAGRLAAYLSPDPKDGKKQPAIIWITGGDCNSIGDVWHESPPANDQTAAAYRKAGIVMMFPSLRGGNNNPGVKEGFLGEVDDVLAALAFLRTQDYVDPNRIYLGGHSTGGTMALLTAECSAGFRAVFSFGPVDDVRGYGPEYCPFDLSNPKEAELRSPGRWLHTIRSPVFVFEGAGGNASSLRAMARASKNAKVQFFEVRGANHFNVLAPTNRLIAGKVLRDTGGECNLAFTTEEVNRAFGR